MKTLKIFLVLFAAPLLLLANHRHANLQGVWVNNQLQKKIEITYAPKGIYVKGIKRYDRVFFKRSNDHTFRDQRNNKIKIKKDGRVYLYDRFRHSKIVFKKAPIRNNCDHFSFYENDHNDQRRSRHNHHKTNNTQDEYYEESPSRNSYKNEERLSGSGLEGTWRISNFEKDILILGQRDGMKAKIKGQQYWTNYKKINSSTFIDKNGNRYVIKNNTILEWLPSNKNEAKLELRKLSDDIKW